VERLKGRARGEVVSPLVYHKGELSKGTIDRQWPHQVALPGFAVWRRELRDDPTLLR
jgi:hypothetical protein